mmetsp:Transcript_19024/g.45674  ORF Transcript_19024/g.45674 Transcript_19024/m.45674 type:complete len:100 (+) Transcript_19024:188-487(+)
MRTYIMSKHNAQEFQRTVWIRNELSSETLNDIYDWKYHNFNSRLFSVQNYACLTFPSLTIYTPKNQREYKNAKNSPLFISLPACHHPLSLTSVSLLLLL